MQKSSVRGTPPKWRPKQDVNYHMGQQDYLTRGFINPNCFPKASQDHYNQCPLLPWRENFLLWRDFLYLATPMGRSEHAKIRIRNMLSEFIEKYNLQAFAYNVWVYFEIFRGCYGLPQSCKLAKYLLRTRLNKSGYFEAATTPGLWRHTWHPI